MDLDREQMGLFERRMRAAGMDRRRFLAFAGGVSLSGALLAACGQGRQAAPTTAPTVIPTAPLAAVPTKPAAEAAKPAAGATTAPAAGATPAAKPAEAAKPAAAAAPAAADMHADQTLRYYLLTDDPASHDFNLDLYCNGFSEMFAGLLQYNANLEVEPYVAEKFEMNADASVYKFTLRKDTLWSSGDPMTAEDFVWSWKRQLDPQYKAPYAAFLYDIKNGEKINKGEAKPETLGVKALDERTLEVTLEGPRAYFPALVAYSAALPGHKKSVEKFGNDWTDPNKTAAPIVSNGPWVLTKWERNKALEFERNEKFFGAKDVKLKKLIIPIIPVAQGILPYEKGEVEAPMIVGAGDLKRVNADAKMSKEVQKYVYPGSWYILPQVTKAPFDNPKVRKALSHAIDRDKIANTVTQGQGLAAHAFIPPGIPGYIDDPKVKEIQKFDPKLAMEALKGTPFEGGKGWPEITLSLREEAHNSRIMAEGIQAMLKEHLGMDTKLQVLEARTFREKLWNLEHQLIFIRWWADYPDPNNEYFDTFYGGKTSGKRQAWKNDKFDELLVKAKGEPDPTKRLDLYKQAEIIMQEEAAYIPVTWRVSYYLYKPWVKGAEKNTAGYTVPMGNIYTRETRYLWVSKDKP